MTRAGVPLAFRGDSERLGALACGSHGSPLVVHRPLHGHEEIGRARDLIQDQLTPAREQGFRIAQR